MGKVKVIVSEDGIITIDAVEGFEGKNCQEVIDTLMANLPTGFSFGEMETIRHGNYRVEQPVPKQKYVQENN
jgi:hypothetical protein